MEWDVERFRIFETVTGSNMYGTSTPESDMDTRGVVVPPKSTLLDPFEGFEQADSFEGKDRCLYSLKKFIKLAADANPNVIELLFAPRECWLHGYGAWEFLLERTHLFVSKKAKYTFTGYSISQLHSIQTHRSYLLSPPKEKPTRIAYGLTDSPRLTVDQVAAISNLPDACFSDDYVDEARKEQRYRSAMVNWSNYESWAKVRNPKRRELEEKFGYDTKHASHLVRLMTEGKELLLTGKITFPLPNAEYIKSIRAGALKYEALLEMVTTLEAEFDVWYAQSPLPFGPDWKGLKQLYFDLIGE